MQCQTSLSIAECERIIQRKHLAETVGSILQAIADLLAIAKSETEYNIIRFWKKTKGSTGFSTTL